MKLSLIVAMSQNRVIGHDGQLPWHQSCDLRRFKRLTMGHHILMGRKTFESIGRQLPGRTTVVITRRTAYELPGGLVARDLEQAIQLAAHDDEAFVIGGGHVFRQALPIVDRMYVTLVHAQVAGDVTFPDFNEDQWQMLQQQRFDADPRNDYDYSFFVFERRVEVRSHFS